MKLSTEQDILDLISADPWMMEVLRVVEKLNLPNCWIGAGFVRNTVWDALFDTPVRTPLDDVDVVFFDSKDQSGERETKLEHELAAKMPEIKWSVTNQARMAKIKGDAPYLSTKDALAAWPETATAVSVRLTGVELELLAPHGIKDMIGGIVRPTPIFSRKEEQFAARQAKKNWKSKWPNLILPRF
ncbi:MAG: nucleotidyltransferase family protein [Candidatus Andersenbacteria bacterium]